MPRVAQLPRPTEIPQSLLDEMAQVCGEPFAVSYLSGAIVRGRGLTPWTQTAEIRLRASSAAMGVIHRAGLKVERAELFGSPNHPASLRMAAE